VVAFLVDRGRLGAPWLSPALRPTPGSRSGPGRAGKFIPGPDIRPAISSRVRIFGTPRVALLLGGSRWRSRLAVALTLGCLPASRRLGIVSSSCEWSRSARLPPYLLPAIAVVVRALGPGVLNTDDRGRPHLVWGAPHRDAPGAARLCCSRGRRYARAARALVASPARAHPPRAANGAADVISTPRVQAKPSREAALAFRCLVPSLRPSWGLMVSTFFDILSFGGSRTSRPVPGWPSGRGARLHLLGDVLRDGPNPRLRGRALAVRRRIGWPS